MDAKYSPVQDLFSGDSVTVQCSNSSEVVEGTAIKTCSNEGVLLPRGGCNECK